MIINQQALSFVQMIFDNSSPPEQNSKLYADGVSTQIMNYTLH